MYISHQIKEIFQAFSTSIFPGHMYQIQKKLEDTAPFLWIWYKTDSSLDTKNKVFLSKQPEGP